MNEEITTEENEEKEFSEEIEKQKKWEKYEENIKRGISKGKKEQTISSHLLELIKYVDLNIENINNRLMFKIFDYDLNIQLSTREHRIRKYLIQKVQRNIDNDIQKKKKELEEEGFSL